MIRIPTGVCILGLFFIDRRNIAVPYIQSSSVNSELEYRCELHGQLSAIRPCVYQHHQMGQSILAWVCVAKCSEVAKMLPRTNPRFCTHDPPFCARMISAIGWQMRLHDFCPSNTFTSERAAAAPRSRFTDTNSLWSEVTRYAINTRAEGPS